MNEILFKIGDRVRLIGTKGGGLATIRRIFTERDYGIGGTSGREIFVLFLDDQDPMTGSRIATAWRAEIGPLDPMDAERLRRRMAFEVASGRKG